MTKLWLALLLVAIIVSSLYKLDYRSFFTDEIAYMHAGSEICRKFDFSLNREVPPVGKYLACFASLLSNRNVFLMRMPFALLFPLSALFAYLIVDMFYGKKWALVAVAIYGTMPFLFSETRMVMLESPLALFWLGFHYFFLRWLTAQKNHDAVAAGAFLGVSLATKIPSIVLIPFVLVILLAARKLSLKAVAVLAGPAFLAYILVFFPLFIREGFLGYLNHIRAVYDAYFVARDQAGKAHVVAGGVFYKSPFWYYLYFVWQRYNPFLLVASAIAPFAVIFNKKPFVYYWLTFFAIGFTFIQILGVKQARYISYVEIPLVFLIVALLVLLANRLKRIGYIFATLLVLSMVGARLVYAVAEKPSGYNALYKYFAAKTGGFTNGERIYMYASIRSSRFYFAEVKPDTAVSRKDWDIMMWDIDTFKYLVFDQDELAKNPDNPFITYVYQNAAIYYKQELQSFVIYTLRAIPPKR